MFKRQKRYQLSGQAFRSNPYPTYDAIRADQPVMRLPYGTDTWIVTAYEEARQVLSDHRRFVKDYNNTLPPTMRPEPNMNDLYYFLYHNMLSVDGDDHARLRTLVSKAFTNRHVQALTPHIQHIADNLIDAFPAEGKVDLVDAYAFPLPIIVIAELLGIPAADRKRFRVWSHAFIGDDTGGDYVQEMMAFVQYIRDVVADRRDNPQDDLISALTQAEEAGDRLSTPELYSMIALLIVAGHETTVNLIANGTLALLQNPAQMTLLKKNPDLIEPAIEEFLRYDGPVERATQRYAAEDVEIGGQQIRRGSSIIVILGAASHDPAQFERADQLDITRESNRHMGFGYGVHYCLGAPLARLEGRIAINTLMQRVHGLELVGAADKLPQRENNVVRGPKHLPVRYKETQPSISI